MITPHAHSFYFGSPTRLFLLFLPMHRSFFSLPARQFLRPASFISKTTIYPPRINRYSTMTADGTNGAGGDSRPVFFFDIDNCLYSKGCNIHDEMQKLINKFFCKHLDLTPEDAHMLHHKYYQEYGLAIEGLTRHHKIDPLEFNYEVDDALPLDTILKPNSKLRTLLESLDTTKVKPWLLTNAYVNHGKRVVKLLGIEDLFEGITYCDYGSLPLVCKPSQDMYAKAEKEAGAPSTESCYFVDDSYLNCKHAAARGWSTVHFVEAGVEIPRIPASKYLISDLEELRVHFPEVFKS